MQAWNGGQKTAFLIGLAVALLVVARVVLAPDPTGTEDGWFNYAPNSGLAYAPSHGRSPVAVGAVWLVATAIWTVVAVWLLRRRDD